MDKKDIQRAFMLGLLTLAILLSLLGAFLDLPLLGRADTDAQAADKHTSILYALPVWAGAMLFWVWWLRAKGRQEEREFGGQSPAGINWNSIGCMGLALGFLGLLALRTAASLGWVQ